MTTTNVQNVSVKNIVDRKNIGRSLTEKEIFWYTISREYYNQDLKRCNKGAFFLSKKSSPFVKNKIGDKVGILRTSQNSVLITLFGKTIYDFQLSFLLANGFLSDNIEHIDGDRTNCNPLNLIDTSFSVDYLEKIEIVDIRGNIRMLREKELFIRKAIMDGWIIQNKDCDKGGLIWGRNLYGKGAYKIKKGEQCGCRCKTNGYIEIKFAGIAIKGHQVSFYFKHGYIPESPYEIDHLDRVRHNNNINNLTEKTKAGNMQNKNVYSNNTSGYTGVFKDKRCSTYFSMIGVDNKYINLGRFKSAELAHEAYLKAKAIHHKNV